MESALGCGTSEEFFEREFADLDLNDQRLNKRCKKIIEKLHTETGSCIRRIFLEPKEARQAYDFF